MTHARGHEPDLGTGPVWEPAPARGPGVDALDAAAAAATRWLSLGRDVLIRADRGAGRSTTLQKVASLVARTGHAAVIVDDANLNPANDRIPRGRGARPEQDVVRQIAGDLGSRGVLLVDDVHELGEQSLEVVRLVLASSCARFVATATGELMGAGHPRALTKILSDRGPAEVELAPLDYPAMTQLVAGRLGGPADATVVSSVMEWSAGNLTTALAVLDAARFAGLLRQRHGTWMLVGEIESAPLESVGHLLVCDLDPQALQALEQLSDRGPISAADARRIVPETQLTELLQRRHVVLLRGGSQNQGDVLAVSPPALAHALRHRREGSTRLETDLGTGVDLASSRAPRLPRTPRGGVSSGVNPRSADPQWAAGAMALVHARAVSEEAAARAAWRADRSIRTAVPYLVLLLRRAGSQRAREVVESTPVREGDDPGEVAMFRLLEERWRVWQGREPDSVAGQGRSPEGPDAESEICRVVRRAGHGRWTDAELMARLDPLAATQEQPWAIETRLRIAGALLAASRFDAVLDVTDGPGGRPDWVPSEYGHYLEGIRTTALLLSGRVDAAVSAAHERLEAAFDERDLPGIRVHSATLSHALALAGHRTLAWQVLNSALRLGPPGPLGNTFYRRTLTLGAVLSAREGTLDVANQLMHELSRTPVGYQPVIGTMGAIAEAYLLRAEHRGAEADELLWDEGARCVAAGWTAPAGEYWALRTTAPTPEQADQLRALLDQAPTPAYSALIELHIALADPDAASLERAVRRAPLHLAPGLAANAVTTLSSARARDGGSLLTSHEVRLLVGPKVAAWLRQLPTNRAGLDELSERELEVSRLAAAGLTNREIGDQLNVSRRTVENHVYRALHKLGLSSRRELAQALPDDR